MAEYRITRKWIDGKPIETVTRKRIDAARYQAHRLVWDMHEANGTLDTKRAWDDVRSANRVSHGTVQLSCAVGGQVVLFERLK